MRTIREATIYKLPAEFVERYRSELEGMDWKQGPILTLDLGWDINPQLELTAGRGAARIVRPAGLKSANLIRRYANALAAEESAS